MAMSGEQIVNNEPSNNFVVDGFQPDFEGHSMRIARSANKVTVCVIPLL
jgi:hypothetical protein